MVHYRCHICQSGLNSVLWPHISILMSLLAAEPRSTAGHLFPSQNQYFSRTILMTLYSMVLDWQVFKSRANAFYWPKLSASIFVCCFPFLFFLAMLSLSPSFALPTIYKKNNNYYNPKYGNIFACNGHFQLLTNELFSEVNICIVKWLNSDIYILFEQHHVCLLHNDDFLI